MAFIICSGGGDEKLVLYSACNLLGGEHDAVFLYNSMLSGERTGRVFNAPPGQKEKRY